MPSPNRSSPKIISTGTALPEHRVEQRELTEAFCSIWMEKHPNVDRVRQLHAATRVKGRNLSLPISAYAGLRSFSKANQAWKEVSVSLAKNALGEALDRASLTPEAIDHVFFVSSTGIATPSLDATLVNEMSLSRSVRRTPIFGLGCAGGAAGISRAADWLRGKPDGVAALVAVELCSLTFQRDDLTISNAIATGLFGDAAAAVILVGGEVGDGVDVKASASAFYPDTEHLMGWEVGDSGLKVRLSPGIPRVVEAHLGGDVDGFLSSQGLSRKEVAAWICHPGGPRVLEAIERTLELPPEVTVPSWQLLEEVGNLSSVSVPFLLDQVLRKESRGKGDIGMLFAMGPGFSSEFVLLQW